MNKNTISNSVKKNTAFILASWFQTGFSPIASGTVGSLFALPLAYFAIYWGGSGWVLAFTALFFLIGKWATKIVLKNTNETDPSFVVIDEVIGQLLTFVLIGNLLHFEMNRWYFLAGFLFFRFFDIVKIWTACYYDEEVQNAHGILMDDVIAGVYAALSLGVLYLYGSIYFN